MDVPVSAHKIESILTFYKGLADDRDRLICRSNDLKSRIDRVTCEQETLESARSVMLGIKQSLTKYSLDYCEQLASYAMQQIFCMDAHVKYCLEDGKFFLIYPDGSKSDIAGDEGGGIKTVLSFVFSLYLIIKQGSRRIMFWDEAWTQVSSEYLPSFIGFVRTVCSDLGFEILLVTHDERISIDDVDSAYLMEEGKCKKLK